MHAMPLAIHMAMVLVIVVVATIPAAWLMTGVARLMVKRLAQRDYRLCPDCGYDLRNVDAERCPECGSRCSSEVLRARWNRAFSTRQRKSSTAD
ncbi:MAG: hypothetical protein AAFX05_02235 [Planctomycetota bacterium]